jgi:hypothetical protein
MWKVLILESASFIGSWIFDVLDAGIVDLPGETSAASVTVAYDLAAKEGRRVARAGAASRAADLSAAIVVNWS